MKLKVSTNQIGNYEVPTDGILYLLVFKLEDKTLVKIGVTQRIKVEDRICEIIVSIWKRYRVFPECVAKRYRSVKEVYKKEKYMHDYFASYNYKTKYVFSGSTQFFTASVDEIVKVYDEITD